jgi:hydrogenase maturation factor
LWNEYKASIAHRVYGTGCPKCGILKSALKRSKQVIMVNPATQEEKIFTSISEASRVLGINSSNISMVCKGQRPKAGGYIGKYLDEEQVY